MPKALDLIIGGNARPFEDALHRAELAAAASGNRAMGAAAIRAKQMNIGIAAEIEKSLTSKPPRDLQSKMMMAQLSASYFPEFIKKFKKPGEDAGKLFSGNFNTAVIREIAVIGREIAMGRGFGRILGSLTLLGQYLFKGFLTALISIPGLVVAAGLAISFFTYKHLQALNSQLDRTAKLMGEAFGDRAKANMDAMKEAARATADFDSWLRKLGYTYEDLAQKTEEELSKMREQFQLMRELARLKGAGMADERAAEQAERKAEMAILEDRIKQANATLEDSKKSAREAQEKAFGSKDAIDRRAKILSIPGDMQDVEKNIPKYTEFVSQLQEKVDKLNEDSALAIQLSNRERFFGLSPEQLQSQIASAKEKNAGTMFAVGPEGQQIQMSLATAQNALRQFQSLKESLPVQQARLEQTQRDLEDAQKEAQSKGDKDSAAVKTLEKRRDDLKDQIALHQQYDAQLNKAEAEKKHSNSGVQSVTERQRMGLGAPQVELMPTVRRIEGHLKQIVTNTSKTGRGAPAEHGHSFDRGSF